MKLRLKSSSCYIILFIVIAINLIPFMFPDILTSIISSTYCAVLFVVINILTYCFMFILIKRYHNRRLKICLKTAEFVVIIAGAVGILSCVKDIKQSYSSSRLKLLNTWITNDSTYLGVEGYKHTNSFPYIKSNYRTEDEHQLFLDQNNIRFQWANEVDSLIKASLRNLEIINLPILEDKYQDQYYKKIINNLNTICLYYKEVSELERIVNSNKMEFVTIGTYILLIAISLQLSIFFFKS